MSQRFLKRVQPLVQAIRLGNENEFQRVFQEISAYVSKKNSPFITTLNQLVMVAIFYPIVFMKVMLGLYYMIEMNSNQITEQIKSNFLTFKDNDDEELKGDETSGFVLFEKVEHNKEKFKNQAQTIFIFLFVGFALLKIEELKNILNLCVLIGDELFGDDTGKKALDACKHSMHTASNATFLSTMGCLTGAITDTEKCAQITAALNALMVPAPSPFLN